MAAALTVALQPQDAFPLTLAEAGRLAGRRCAVASGAWELLGHRELAATEARKLLYCYDDGGGGNSGGGGGADAMNACLAGLKLALAALRGGGGRYVHTIICVCFDPAAAPSSTNHPALHPSSTPTPGRTSSSPTRTAP